MKRLFYMVAALALFASCTNNDIPTSSDKVALKINSASTSDLLTKAAFANQTEVAIIASNGGLYGAIPKTGFYTLDQWDANGVIDHNLGYTWGPKTADDKLFLTPTPISLTAYVPSGILQAMSIQDDKIPLQAQELLTSWESNYNNTDNRDICVARKNFVNSGSNGLDLSLAHICALLEFQFTKDAGFNSSPGKISKIILTGPGVSSSANYNIKTAEWEEPQVVSNTLQATFVNQNSSFETTTDVSSRAIAKILVPPAILQMSQTYSLKVTLDNIDYYTSIPYTVNAFQSFEPNKRYIIEMKFTATGISVGTVTRLDWSVDTVNSGNPLKPVIVL